MAADWTITASDTEPLLYDELTYSNSEPVNLEGATLTFILRAQTANKPQVLTGKAVVLNAKEGKVVYEPTTADTAIAGNYMASWHVKFAGGETQTFPTVGFLWLEIQPNLTSESTGTLVSLPELKNYLNIEANDRTHDTKLARYIEAVRPIIEGLTGPILPQVFDEWYEGGNYFVSLRRRPSSTFGTTPLYTLMACSEYRGPIEYPLSIIDNPAEGTIYSCMFFPREGVVERRTSGGGVMAFPKMAHSVHVVYRCGQETVPANVEEAALETIRINYQTTQAVGTGRQTVADAEEVGSPEFSMFLPRRIREMLAPNRRAPSIC